jgi:hypothetical protein
MGLRQSRQKARFKPMPVNIGPFIKGNALCADILKVHQWNIRRLEGD